MFFFVFFNEFIINPNSDRELGAAAAGQPRGTREQRLGSGGGAEAVERGDEAAGGGGKNARSVTFTLEISKALESLLQLTLSLSSFAGRDRRGRAAV